MLDSSFRISPKGAFSCEWNKDADRNVFCAVKIGHSVYAFFKALFFKYTVCRSEVDENFLVKKSRHENSFFGKEYRKLVEIKTSLKSPQGDSVESGTVDKVWAARIFFDVVEQLINGGDFNEAADYFSEQNITLLKSKESCRLFNKMCAASSIHDVSSSQLKSLGKVAYSLLLTGHCDNLINLLGGEKETPMSFFLDCDFHPGVIYLIENGIGVINEAGKDGRTPLMIVAEDGCVDGIQVLLEEEVDINACDKNGVTALHYAVGGNCVGELLKRGGDLDAKDSDGNTPLHYAAQNGMVDSLGLLLKEGANFKTKNNNGETPLGYAREVKNEECVKLLEGNGCVE